LTVALPTFVLSTRLVAVIVTACAEEMGTGAVYSPFEEIVPTGGLIDQLTAGLAVPVTVGENCVCPPVNETDTGVTITVIAGRTVSNAAAIAAGFAVLVAITSNVCSEVTDWGAV
jgi:hypothetical protein